MNSCSAPRLSRTTSTTTRDHFRVTYWFNIEKDDIGLVANRSIITSSAIEIIQVELADTQFRVKLRLGNSS